MTLQEYAISKGFTLEELRRFGVNVRQGRVAIPFKVRDGSVHRHQFVSTDPGKRFTWETGDGMEGTIVYGLDRPVPWGALLWLVEGASDCWSLWLAGQAAIGLPGATNVKPLAAVDFQDVKTIAVIEEPDSAGQRMPHLAATTLYDAGFQGDVVRVSLNPFKDAREAFIADRSKFRKVLELAWKSRTPIPRPEPVKSRQRNLFQAVTMAEAFDSDTAIAHLVEGLVPRGGSMVVGAKKKVGKSVLLMNLARAVARGETFLGRRCQKGPVLYISCDEPKSVTLDRASALGLNNEPNIFLLASRAVPDDWAGALRSEYRRLKPILVIVDTLAKLARIKDINSYGEWGAAYAPLQAMGDEFGCAYVVSVHNKKEGATTPDSMAGSTAIGGGVDTILVMARCADGSRTIETEQRLGQDMARSVLRMDEEYRLSIGGEAWLDEQRELEREIFRSLGDESITLEEILRRVPRRGLVVKRALYASVDTGWILRSGSGKRGDPHVYRVSDMGLNRDQETRKPLVDNVSCLVPKKAQFIGTHSDQETEDEEEGWSVVTGPRLDQAGPTGTNRDQETEEEDLLDKYAYERNL